MKSTICLACVILLCACAPALGPAVNATAADSPTQARSDMPVVVELPPKWTTIPTPTPERLNTQTQTLMDAANSAPDFSGATLDGGIFQLRDHPKTIVALLFATATSEPSQKVMGLMADAHKNFPPILFVIIDEKDDATAAKSFISQYKLDFPCVLDQDGAIAGLYTVSDLPQLILIYTDGKIHQRIVGELTQAKLKSYLKKTY
jgi:cytochrome c biogenesis protein CcmG, thiol:disulfide interchange protein DsbE